jgi:hypothetical protein
MNAWVMVRLDGTEQKNKKETTLPHQPPEKRGRWGEEKNKEKTYQRISKCDLP